MAAEERAEQAQSCSLSQGFSVNPGQSFAPPGKTVRTRQPVVCLFLCTLTEYLYELTSGSLLLDEWLPKTDQRCY